jgi:hypothetical protein
VALSIWLLPEIAAAAAVCDATEPEPPTNGTFYEHNLSDGTLAWSWALNDGCQYALWEATDMAQCFRDKWIVIVGASNANIWMMQLANMLSPGALDTKKDNFTIDGASTQLIDIVIKDGKVIYSQVLVDEQVLKFRKWTHTYARDHKVLREAFGNVSLPEYTEGAVRITNFLGEFWDHVQLATEAVQAATNWARAEVTVWVSIGLWYMNSVNCWWAKEWCATRPQYTPPKMKSKELFKQFRHGMHAALQVLDKFCSGQGRAGRLGCVVSSIEHCPFSKGPNWVTLVDSINETMAPFKSRHLRFLDVWTLTLSLPEGTMGEHQSPMSTLWTMQTLIGGICPKQAPSKGTLAVFRGKMCRAEQVEARCPKKEALAKGFQHEWECAMAELCTLEARTAGAADQIVQLSDADGGTSLRVHSKALRANTFFRTRELLGHLPYGTTALPWLGFIALGVATIGAVSGGKLFHPPLTFHYFRIMRSDEGSRALGLAG